MPSAGSVLLGAGSLRDRTVETTPLGRDVPPSGLARAKRVRNRPERRDEGRCPGWSGQEVPQAEAASHPDTLRAIPHAGERCCVGWWCRPGGPPVPPGRCMSAVADLVDTVDQVGAGADLLALPLEPPGGVVPAQAAEVKADNACGPQVGAPCIVARALEKLLCLCGWPRGGAPISLVKVDGAVLECLERCARAC